jgi:glycosyltransferase involved in cell wall biosynthesis
MTALPPRGRFPGRVVLFTPGVSEIGGAANRSRLLAEGLAELGLEVRVVARSGTGRRVTRSVQGRVSTVEVPGFGIRPLGAILYLVLALPLGIVWGRSSRGFIAVQLTVPALVAGLAAWVVRRPYVAFTSTTGELSEVRAVRGSRGRWLKVRLLSRAAALVAQTEAGAAELLELVPPDRTAVVPTPIRPVAARPLDGAPHVAYVGRLSQEKDLLRLLDAWCEVLVTIPTARLTLVGEGGAHRSVEAEIRGRLAADPALSASVTLTGWVLDPWEHVAACDVFVLPSLTEGMSNALLEACALGRVVVVSDIPGNRAVVGSDHPLLFEAGDVEAMAATLERALTDDATRGEAIRQVRVRLPSFALQRIARDVLELLDREPVGGGRR